MATVPSLDFRPQRPRELLGVYRDEEAAQHLLERVTQLADEHGRVGDSGDYVDSLRGEMRQELEDTIVAPQAALVLTKEATKTMAFVLPVATAIGAVLGLILAFVFGGSISVAGRVITGLVVGAAGGATVGFIVGAAVGMKGPAEQAAAQRGVTVRVWPDRDDVRQVMMDAAPIRLDVVDDAGQPIDTLLTEEANAGEGATAPRLGRRLTEQRQGDWSPVQADDPRHGRSVPGQEALSDDD